MKTGRRASEAIKRSVRNALGWFPRHTRPSFNTYGISRWTSQQSDIAKLEPGTCAPSAIKAVDLCFETIIGIYDTSPPGEPVFLPNPRYIEIR